MYKNDAKMKQRDKVITIAIADGKAITLWGAIKNFNIAIATLRKIINFYNLFAFTVIYLSISIFFLLTNIFFCTLRIFFLTILTFFC